MDMHILLWQFCDDRTGTLFQSHSEGLVQALGPHHSFYTRALRLPRRALPRGHDHQLALPFPAVLGDKPSVGSGDRPSECVGDSDLQLERISVLPPAVGFLVSPPPLDRVRVG